VVSADEALSPVEAPLAALSASAGELSRGDWTVLSPASVWPNAVPGAVKPNKQSAIRMWCTAMTPESIGLGRPYKSTARKRFPLLDTYTRV
jgi:hypothetical protein